MQCKIKNNSDFDVSEIIDLLEDLFSFSQDRFGFKKPPTLNLVSDAQNTSPLGKTAHYDPSTMEIVVYVDGRHPKDIMRSFSHELVHHNQNENGMFDTNFDNDGDGYAQSNPHLRKMEKEAYLKGNMCFRDWEDGYKSSNPNILNERRIYKMSTKKWKNKELGSLLNEKWGFSMNLGKLNEAKKEYNLEEGHDRIFAPNHYCLHHVIYEGKEGKTVDHNWDEKLQKVTKYDVKFEDGSIIRNIHESKLTVLEAFTEEEHKRDDDKHPPVKKEEKEGESDDVAARTAPFDDENKADFLPKKVRDKINKKEKGKKTKKPKKGEVPEQFKKNKKDKEKIEEMDVFGRGAGNADPKDVESLKNMTKETPFASVAADKLDNRRQVMRAVRKKILKLTGRNLDDDQVKNFVRDIQMIMAQDATMKQAVRKDMKEQIRRILKNKMKKNK